jgi:hypothetical protein
MSVWSSVDTRPSAVRGVGPTAPSGVAVAGVSSAEGFSGVAGAAGAAGAAPGRAMRIGARVCAHM